VDLLILTNNPERASFRQRVASHLGALQANGINSEIVKFPPGPVERRKLFQQAVDFDGVLLHKKALNSFDAHWLRRYSRKVVYDFDDAIMYSEKHPSKPSRKRKKSFQRTVELADMVIAENPCLAEQARQFNMSVEVLPTGLDTHVYKLEGGSKKDDGKIRLVWIGSSATLKYLAEIKPVLEEIGSRFDNVVLRVIADEFLELRNMQVEKRRWSLEEEAADIGECHVGLAPLPDNKFTQSRFCFKIFQYAAAGLPTIASPVGANPVYLREGVNGFFATDHSDWIEKTSRLIKEAELRNQIGQAAKREVEQFDIRVVGKQLSDLLLSCLRGDSV
jgi:glycosyltransferase involved in cell wall biosynthesis